MREGEATTRLARAGGASVESEEREPVVDPNDATIPSDGPPLPSITSESAARRVGRYALLRKVGEGGMGVVYAAYDEQLDRKVALKLLRAEPGSVERQALARARLAREAQAMAKVAHPNVAPIFDVGEHDGKIFVAMEFVAGETLADWVRARSIDDWHEVLAMFVQAGKGLAAAHRAGIVHRDFKPDNVMVGADGRARVLDFGLARSHGGGEEVFDADAIAPKDRALSKHLTHAHTMLGTPSYMAPEQFRGRAVDPKCDQFAFAVSIYKSIYRASPFAGDELLELMNNVLAGALRPPPASSGVPRWIERVVARGLATDPDARWESLDRMIEEIERELGRDRELDVSVSARARMRAVGALLGVCVVISIPAVWLRDANAWRPIGVFWLGVVGMAVILALGFVFREHVLKTVLNRRIAALFLFSIGGTVVNRALGVVFDTDVARTLAADAVIIASVLGVGAVTVDRSTAASALLAVATAIVIALFPANAVRIFPAFLVLACLAAIRSWRDHARDDE